MSSTSTDHIYGGDLKRRATSRESLDTRLDVNRRYQSIDFHAWLHRRLDVRRGEQILDVGCGDGAQSLEFLKRIGQHGTISALDINGPSVASLLERANHDPRLHAVAADMADIRSVIQTQFTQKSYSLAQSAYALYYSPDRLDVLRCMADSIVDTGRVAVFTPATPHGLVDLAAKFCAIPQLVTESLQFGPTVLEPEFRSLFWEVEIHFFQSEMRVTSLDDFMRFYEATTYYTAEGAEGLRAHAAREIESHGAVVYSKNGYLIIGRDRR